MGRPISGVAQAKLTNNSRQEALTFSSMSKSSAFSEKRITYKELDGGTKLLRTEYRLELIILEQVDYNKLVNWMDTEDDIAADVTGRTEKVDWDEATSITVEKVYLFEPRRINATRVLMTKRGKNLNIIRTQT